MLKPYGACAASPSARGVLYPLHAPHKEPPTFCMFRLCFVVVRCLIFSLVLSLSLITDKAREI